MTETERKILESAREVLLERGIDGARMDEIARRAGVNKALLHYYFGSKQHLCECVLKEAVRELLGRAIGAASPHLPARQALERFVSEYIDFVAANSRLTHFVLWELRHGGRSFVQAYRQFLDDSGLDNNPLVELFRRAASRGEIRPVDPVHTTLSLIGTCVFTFVAADVVSQTLGVEDVFAPQFLEERKRQIVDLFWEGLKPASGPAGTEPRAPR